MQELLHMLADTSVYTGNTPRLDSLSYGILHTQ